MQALGFIETRSLTASIEASDVMTKTADVWVVGTEKIGSGLVNVVIQGDVDAVTAAVKARYMPLSLWQSLTEGT